MSTGSSFVAIPALSAIAVSWLLQGCVSSSRHQGSLVGTSEAGVTTVVKTMTDCDGCPVMSVIPSGSFWMGSERAETDREGVPTHQAEPEWPRHRVTITKPFALSQTEVTQTQYARFAEETGRAAQSCLLYRDQRWGEDPATSWRKPPFEQSGNHPVICVNWDDASAYAQWLGEKTGENYRLPSEAEWEYAARAGTSTARYWGDGLEEACDYANVADANAPRAMFECVDPYVYTAPAHYGIANDFQLYGMLGNVGEWVQDCNYPDYAEAPTDGSAAEGEDCSTHVGRGGSWWNDAYYIRAARRFHMAGAYHIVGFRVARDLTHLDATQ